MKGGCLEGEVQERLKEVQRVVEVERGWWRKEVQCSHACRVVVSCRGGKWVIQSLVSRIGSRMMFI